VSVWLPSASYWLIGRIFPDMPVEFLTDDEAAAHGRYAGVRRRKSWTGCSSSMTLTVR
jgi:hypothetical protein